MTKPIKTRRTTKMCTGNKSTHHPKYTEHEERLYDGFFIDECQECGRRLNFSTKRKK